MKSLYLTYGSIAASFALLLGIWGAVEAPQPVQKPTAELTLSLPETPDTLTSSGGRAALYDAVASLNDIARYRAIAKFTAEKKWNDADSIIARLENPVLVGHFLAARYGDKDYAPSALQLKMWLEKNGSLPQAPALLQRMRKLYPQEAKHIHLPATPNYLQGNSASSRAVISMRAADRGLWKNGITSLSSGDYRSAYRTGTEIVRVSNGESQHGNWLAGLAAWRLKDYSAAAKHFSAMASSEHVAPAYQAAAAFWAYRAYTAQGDAAKASHYLNVAADAPQSFYGLLAAAEQGDAIWHPHPADLTRRHGWKQFIRQKPVEQIVLLHAIQEEEAAERLLRASYFSFRYSDRETLTELAHTLGMASAVLPMARYAKAQEPALQAALYPVPEWQERLARSTDHALILAIAKQESGFNARARSPQGATGLMQILPSTADYIRRQKGALDIETAAIGAAGFDALPHSWDLQDPSYNLAIGQAYVRYLSSKPYIQGNLVYLLVGYNAGAAALLRWREKETTDDPLFFMETIPYEETRHYVRNVLRNYWIYRGMLKDESVPASLARLNNGHWPKL